MRKLDAIVPRTTIHLGTAGVVLCLVACGGALLPEPVTPAGQAVHVGTGDPAPGLTELGPIEVTNGNNCGAYGQRGTYEGAYAMLRNQAAARGATYVKITEQVGPHLIEHCSVNAFVIRGLMYAGTPSATTATTAGSEAPTGGCSPPCSPGYACQAATCVALCNPPCSPGYVCAQDRTCQPAAPTAP